MEREILKISALNSVFPGRKHEIKPNPRNNQEIDLHSKKMSMKKMCLESLAYDPCPAATRVPETRWQWAQQLALSINICYVVCKQV